MLRTNDINTPEFGTLYWDNLKTTTFFGGGSFGFVTAAAAIPVEVLCGDKNCFCVGASFGLGAVIGMSLFSPIGAILAIPFAASSYWRKFKSDTYIQTQIDLIEAIKDDNDKQYIIDEIRRKNGTLHWGITSYESSTLVSTLHDDESLEKKWEALLIYLNRKSSSDAFVHNGKRLFNSILTIPNTPQFIKRKLQFDLREAIKKDNLELVKDLIKNNKNLDLNETDYCSGMTPLHYAARHNSSKTLKNLIERKVNLNIEANCPDTQQHGKTALYMAIESNNVDAVKLLGATKAKINLNGQNKLPYFIAAQNGSVDIIKLGTYKNLTKTNLEGRTLLHCAAEHGHRSVIKYLAENQLPVMNSLIESDKKIKGKTAIQYAEANGYSDIANFLSEKGAVDHDLDKLKNELKILTNILGLKRWKIEGWSLIRGCSLFQAHVPSGVIELRNQLKNYTSEHIDGCDRQEIFKLADALKHIYFGISLIRSPNTKALYSFVKKLGQNSEADLSRFNKFYVVHTANNKPQNKCS